MTITKEALDELESAWFSAINAVCAEHIALLKSRIDQLAARVKCLENEADHHLIRDHDMIVNRLDRCGKGGKDV